MNGVLVRLLPELEGEEGVLAPRDVLLDVDLLLIVAEVREPLPPDGEEVDLRPRGQVNEPELGVAGVLRAAHEVVRRGSEKVTSSDAAKRPPAAEVIAHRDLEFRGLVFLVLKDEVRIVLRFHMLLWYTFVPDRT